MKGGGFYRREIFNSAWKFATFYDFYSHCFFTVHKLNMVLINRRHLSFSNLCGEITFKEGFCLAKEIDKKAAVSKEYEKLKENLKNRFVSKFSAHYVWA